MSDDAFKAFVERKRMHYKKVRYVYSPALKVWISFNSEGFNHLISKRKGVPRTRAEQAYKLNLLKWVMLVIEKSLTVHDVRPSFCSLMATVGKGNLKIKVVVKETGKKGYQFWSVMRVN